MNRKEFTTIYLDTVEVINMLDKSDRNIYNFLDMFGKMYYETYYYTIKFDVKDYNKNEIDDNIYNLINKAENLFYSKNVDTIYRECLDIYGDDVTINKFTVRYFEKRNIFIDKIIENIIKEGEKNEENYKNNNNEL